MSDCFILFIFGQVEGDGVGVGPMGFYCRERQFAKHQHDEHFCLRGRCHHGQPSPPQSRCVCRAPGPSVGFERAARLVEGTFGTVRCVCGQVLVVVLGGVIFECTDEEEQTRGLVGVEFNLTTLLLFLCLMFLDDHDFSF